MHYGIDIGGTKTEIAVYDQNWQVQSRWREPTPAADGDALLGLLQTLVQEADRRAGVRGTLGIGVPGVLDRRGCLIAANLPGLRDLPLGAALTTRLERQPVLENDSRCFIVSEVGPGGAAAAASHAFGAILGTGAGGGAVIEGQLLRGAGGLAGEWGHLPLPALARERHDLPRVACGCGLPDCLESYIAGPGLVRLHHHFGGESESTLAWQQALQAGEDAARRAHDCHLELLGGALANVVKLLAPEVIVVGGGVSLVPGLVEALPAALAEHLFAGVPTPAIVRSRFGDASGVRGAAMLGARARMLT
ncbi:ROK family protein [Salinicola avicenniae]|uniref:ROK family protein n=1 Tax=Salinicola avicenniae TaxID=2916836 RepID=UPI002072FF04|nr:MULTISPECIES: ROK family protein [unclassified Salinicola]